MSANELPNLPGLRRTPSRIVMKAREELRQATRGSELEDMGEEEEMSFTSYFGDSSRLLDMSKSLSAFPSNAGSMNDISGRYSLRSQQQARLSKSLSLPFTNLDYAPPFVVNQSERVCRFLAYFSESIPENLIETVRSRKVEIKFYTEDDTIEVIEPKERNSGLVQGKVLKRHQIAKPRNPEDTLEGEIYQLHDFQSGVVLEMYNRRYTVIDCDLATRRHMEELGIDFGESLSMPSNYTPDTTRSAAARSSASRVPTASKGGSQTGLHSNPKITGFHQYGRTVLRFFGVWDSSGDLFGDELTVRLHYILADDTIEILPTYERNCGRDKLQMLLKRTKVMKRGIADDEGSYSQLTTNSLGLSSGSVSRGNQVPLRPYHWTDLHIGDTIPVAAMTVMLTDADQFTRDFYASKHMPLGPAIAREKKVYPKFEVIIPPHNGFGSEIDSMTSCKGSLMPLPPHKDGAKLKAFQGMILRYQATLDNPKASDRSRSFIIQVHLEDDTIQVLEPPQRNSGHKGGVFLNRGKIEPHDDSPSVVPQDLYLGAVVPIYGFRFLLHDADEYTLRHMEENCREWGNSDLSKIVEKLKDHEEVLTRLILTSPGLSRKEMTYAEVLDFFLRAGTPVVKQEVVTLLRVLDPKKYGSVKLTKILKFILGQK